eukprot:1143207-Pelagomonas_calceolata.AAC.3
MKFVLDSRVFALGGPERVEIVCGQKEVAPLGAQFPASLKGLANEDTGMVRHTVKHAESVGSLAALSEGSTQGKICKCSTLLHGSTPLKAEQNTSKQGSRAEEGSGSLLRDGEGSRVPMQQLRQMS